MDGIHSQKVFSSVRTWLEQVQEGSGSGRTVTGTDGPVQGCTQTRTTNCGPVQSSSSLDQSLELNFTNTTAPVPEERAQGSEWEYHTHLCTTPCDEAQEYLPPGTLLPPPPVQSPNDWTPYHDCVDFELTDFLYRKVRMSGTSVDTLSQLICASLITHSTTPDDINLFESHTNILSTIDSTPLDGIIPSWMTRSYDFWYHDPWQLIHNLLANWDFNADYIAQDPNTHGAMLVPLILGRNKTTVSVAMGQNEYYPLYLSIGNIRNNVHHAHHNALVLLGFLAIPKTDKQHTDKSKFRKFSHRIFHTSLACILDIGPYIADYPEQALLTCIVQGWCPHCTEQASSLHIDGEHQSQEVTAALLNTVNLDTLWYQYGIVGDVKPFTWEFPHADIHRVISPDILHQAIKGTFKDHLVTWVKLYLKSSHTKTHAKAILDDIDHRIALTPSFPGLRCFPQGCSFKQWTGNDSKALMKVYVPALEGHVPPDMIHTFCAFLDFCYLVHQEMINDDTLVSIQAALTKFNYYHNIFQTTGVRNLNARFNLPQQHSLSHYPQLIHLFGAPNGLCSSITESKHIKSCMLKTIEWHSDDPMDTAPANISVSSINGDHGGDNDNDDGHSSDNSEADGTQGCVSHHDVNTPAGSDVPLEQCTAFNSKISVCTIMDLKKKNSLSDPCGLHGMHRETICATPLLAIFSFHWMYEYYPCALVRWFTHMGDEPDKVVNMWVVQPDSNPDGSPAVGVVHLDLVLHAVHLMPMFGDHMMPMDLTSDQSLDIFQSFYVNRYIDYHAFEIAL
ncbi:hypothetical protein EI94DRAFT_1772998 [Lactarius quietus]|nr:hypothetical protein EI94DRAFT_1772998 [Lactarius quietus]